MIKVRRNFDCPIPVNVCNLKCDYCYVRQWRALDGEGPDTYYKFKYPLEHMIKALSPERFGGVCLFNLCGNGETLLHPQIVPLTEMLVKQGHFVNLITNGTITKEIEYLCSLDEELRSKIFFKFSFHFLELKRTNLLDTYFANVRKVHEANVSFTIELAASDSNVPHIEEIKKLCIENVGALCHLAVLREATNENLRNLSEMSMDDHIRAWKQFDSALFDYKHQTWGKNRQEYFCYGGVWALRLELFDGKLKQCTRNADTIQYIFENIDEPIHYFPIGHSCPLPHCYNSHANDCFAGVIPELDSPTYDVLRDRIMPDGAHWLKGPYLDVFSRRLCDNNEPYSEEMKCYIDGIMYLAHNKDVDEKFREVVAGYLSPLKGKNISVMGDNNITKWLCDNYGYDVYNEVSNCDMIIVTNFADFAQIKSELKNKTNSEIISIVDLPDVKDKNDERTFFN